MNHFHNTWGTSEKGGAEKANDLLGALRQGGEAYFQAKQKAKLMEYLEKDAAPLNNTPSNKSQPSNSKPIRPTDRSPQPQSENAQKPEEDPNKIKIPWQEGDLLVDPRKSFHLAQLYQNAGDHENAKFQKTQGERASIDSREFRKENIKVGSASADTLNGAKKLGTTYNTIENITDKMRDTRKGNEFWNRISKNLKINEDGTFSDIGKLFSTPDEELMVKSIQSLVKGAKEQYGSRVTNFDVINFLSQHPTLWQSEGGRKKVIQALQVQNNLTIEREKLLQQGLAETNYLISPATLQLRVDEAMAPLVEQADMELAEIVASVDPYQQKEEGNLPENEGVRTVNGQTEIMVNGKWLRKKKR